MVVFKSWKTLLLRILDLNGKFEVYSSTKCKTHLKKLHFSFHWIIVRMLKVPVCLQAEPLIRIKPERCFQWVQGNEGHSFFFFFTAEKFNRSLRPIALFKAHVVFQKLLDEEKYAFMLCLLWFDLFSAVWLFFNHVFTKKTLFGEQHLKQCLWKRWHWLP